MERAAVSVDGETISTTRRGLVALVGISEGDSSVDAVSLASRAAELRIFADGQGRMGRSVLDIEGAVMVVSQFTLCADVSKGRRPSFTAAAAPDIAEPLVEAFARELERRGIDVGRGVFGAHMSLELVNDGPVTIVMDSK